MTRFFRFRPGLLLQSLLMAEEMEFSSEPMMRAVQLVPGPGGPENLKIRPTKLPTVRKGEVLVRVISTAINRADILQRKGLYPPPAGESDIIGLEAAGLIEPLDFPMSDKWKPKSKVMALLPGGGYAELVAVKDNHIMPLPANMTWTNAGAIPEVWLTAYQLLFSVAEVKKGQSVLIHAAASGVGTAAIQLVTKVVGGKVFATVGSEEKAKFVRDLGASVVVNYKTTEDFSVPILEATNGEGVDVVLDCVGTSYWEKNFRSIKTDGRWILYGLMGGNKIDGDFLAQLLRKRVRIEGTTLRSRSDEYKAKLVADFTRDILPLFDDGTLKPVVDKVFSLGQVGDAHRYVEENRNIGKVVLLVQAPRETEEELQ